MISLNKCQIIGVIGADCDVRWMPNGTTVCNMRVATEDSWVDKQTKEDKTAIEWHRVIVFGDLADRISPHAKKGATIYVEGRIRQRIWTDKEGVERYTTEIDASDIKVIDVSWKIIDAAQ